MPDKYDLAVGFSCFAVKVLNKIFITKFDLFIKISILFVCDFLMEFEMENEIVIYQPNNTIHLEVMMEEETVWLTQNQMVELYERDISVISRHIQNVFKDGEVDKESNLHFLQIANSDRPVAFYSLDVIISVGYRVKSKRGVEFRKWANSVLKEYLLKGYAVNQRIDRLERRVSKTEEKIDFFVRTSLPPVEGVFFQGQIFDAYAKFESFIQSAEHEIVLIDNYIDLSVLERLSKKQKDVKVTIYTDPKTKLSEQDIHKFNEQYLQLTLKHTTKAHDRFLIIDNKILYHIGASLKDLGKKCFAFEVLDSAWIKEILKNL